MAAAVSYSPATTASTTISTAAAMNVTATRSDISHITALRALRPDPGNGNQDPSRACRPARNGTGRQQR